MKYEIITIRGNQDRQIYEASGSDITDNPTMKFVLGELEGEPLEWIRTLPEELQLDDNVHICHGGPGDDMVYLLENIESGYPEVRSNREIKKRLHGLASPLILCGHTHIPRTVVLESGQLIVNPGSVGLPAYFDDDPIPHAMETYSPHASYALLEIADNGWTVQHYRVPYDVEVVVEQCHNLQREDWAYFLKTGRADRRG